MEIISHLMQKNTYNGQIFKSERERLKLTQDNICEIVEVSKKTVLNWEKGSTSPNASQLNCLWHHGFDVTLIVTGERVENNLSDEEKYLLSSFSNASETLKKAAIAVLESEPITVTDRITVEEDERFCEDANRLKITGVTQIYSNSEGREVNRVMVPPAEYDAHKADTNNVLSTYNQLSEASQKRLAEDIQNAFIREQQEAALNQILEGNQVQDPTTKKPRL